jgi:hypothetical protein
MTRVAWQMKKNEIQKDTPGITRRRFIYNLSRASYEKNWKEQYRKPGLGTDILAFLIRLIPKIGPFRTLAFRVPTPADETMFMSSFNASLQNYQATIREVQTSRRLDIENDNFDTGSVTGPGEYPLADATYAELVDRLDKNNFSQMSPQLREVLLSYYANLEAPFATKTNKKKWKVLVQEIVRLKTVPPSLRTDANADGSTAPESSLIAAN